MQSKGRRRGLLRPPKTIKGQDRIPKSLKPQKARQLIRRFHVLQKNKNSIIQKLNKSSTFKNLEDKLTSNNIESILDKYYPNLANSYRDNFEKFKLPVKYIENELAKLDNVKEIDLVKKLADIDAETYQRGGIEAYQAASSQGQNSKRGGDSSKKLIEWLNNPQYQYKQKLSSNEHLNALEIGCLSSFNIISTCGIFKDIVKIDLNSQDRTILKQDFMERPLPKSDKERFNLVSCSLVINFVPSPQGRGEMLKRITEYLKPPTKSSISLLFLVLPLPCVSNSRYFDKDHLDKIMVSLGFQQKCYYEAKKVAYWLFDWNGRKAQEVKFRKTELHSGSTRNNFCIILE